MRRCPYCGAKDPTDQHLEDELKKHDALMRKGTQKSRTRKSWKEKQ